MERLEEMLGRLRHTARAPELPFELGARAASAGLEGRAPSRAGVFSPAFFLRHARLAAAAALLLAVLAGAFVMLRTVNTDGGQASANKENQVVTKPQTPAPEQKSPREELSAPAVVSSPPKEFATPEKLRREPLRRNELVGSKPPFKSQRRESVASRMLTREVKPATAQGGVLEGSAPDVESRMRAKEQLVHALLLTSEALKEVRGRASGVEVRPSAFDGRNPPQVPESRSVRRESLL